MNDILKRSRNIKRIVDSVRKAFQDCPYPRGQLYERGIGLFEDPEFLRIVTLFEGNKWQDLQVDFLRDNYDSLFVFTPQAFRYFMPAYLIAIVEQYDEADILVDTLILRLTYHNYFECFKEWSNLNPFAFMACLEGCRISRLQLREFTQKECVAIYKCLHFLAYDKEEDMAKEALNYWEVKRGEVY